MSASFDVLASTDEALMEMPETPAVEAVAEPAGAAQGQVTPAEGQEQPQEQAAPPEDAGAAAEAVPAQGAPQGGAAEVEEATRLDPGAVPEPEKKTEEYAKLKDFYDRVMGPIKAAGKTIQLTSADEVISLLQKGADYSRKTAELSHYRKYGMMLEKAGLLDESKLDLVIAVAKGDKEALKKLFKEIDVDPVDIDTTGGDNYKPGAHVVPDEQAKLQEAVSDLVSREGGTETHDLVRDTWDKTSKQILWKYPEVLLHIHEQRLSGVYAKITAEVERRKVLGTLPADKCFLELYRQVGDEMYSRPGTQGSPGGGNTAVTKAPAPAGGRTPVTRRPASPPTGTTPGNPAARAAAATRTTPKSKPAVPNIMSLSDEELAKL